jgi:hypothetical protein
MDGLAHLLDRTVYPLQPFIVIVALIAWGVGVVSVIRNRIKKSTKRFPRSFVAAAIVFTSIIGLEFALVDFVKREALTEIAPRLSNQIESVSVNGARIGKSDLLVEALRNMHGTIGHHSHPTASYQVLLTTSRGSLQLDLERDSQDPHEYWVFYAPFHITRLNDVGHAFTDALDGM